MLNTISTISVFLLAISAPSCLAGFEYFATNTSFQHSGTFLGTVYDGLDTVYIFGGQSSPEWQNVFTYSISSGALEQGGEQGGFYGGGMILDDEGYITYFGGYRVTNPSSPEIWRVKASNPSDRTLLNNLPRGVRWPAVAWDKHEYVYLFGGSFIGAKCQFPGVSSDILRFSTSTYAVDVVGKLPAPVEYAKAVYDQVNSVAYIFGGLNSAAITKFDTATGEVTPLDVSLPRPTTYTCAVWTGKHAYIVGGDKGKEQVIIRFTPGVNKVEEVPVTGYPSGLWAHSCVFVERLNRIYIFGGVIQTCDTAILAPNVAYISLGDGEEPSTTTTTTRPTTTSTTTTTTTTTTTETPDPDPHPVNCAGVPNYTLLPDPTSCYRYYQCINGFRQIYQCRSGYVFCPPDANCVPETRCEIDCN